MYQTVSVSHAHSSHPLIMALKKYQTSKLLQTDSVHFLGNVPYYFTLYFLKSISAQFKTQRTVYSFFTFLQIPRCRNSHIKYNVHDSNKRLLTNTYSWVVINSDTMHGKCKILSFKITVLHVMGPCNVIGVLRFQSRHTASTFRWPVKIPNKLLQIIHIHVLDQCFSTAGPQPVTGTWHQLYRAARGSPGICHFSFLGIFNELVFYRGNILRRIIFVNVSKSSGPEHLNNICVANISDQAAYF